MRLRNQNKKWKLVVFLLIFDRGGGSISSHSGSDNGGGGGGSGNGSGGDSGSIGSAVTTESEA